MATILWILGVAVALRPGDILIFNPNEQHAISSRCRDEDDVYITTLYLKTAIVSLNDNKTPLTEEQENLLKMHKEC